LSSASGPEVLAAARADDAARERAIDPHLSVILQAPAGSGKTTVLTQRLLRLLAAVDEPEEILAITFTRRAAAEMRARVLRALRGEIADDAQGERLRQLAAAALQRSQARGWRLAQDPGRLRIQTIDSFSFRLASQLPVTARAGSELSVSSRPEELYRLAARETLLAAEEDAELSTDLELLFERLDNRWGHVERLLADMLRQRAHWLPHVLGHGPDALCRRVAASLTRIVEDRLEAARRSLGFDVCVEAARLPGVGPLESEARCLESWKTLARLALTKDRDWRKRIDRGLGAGFENGAGKEALRACIERLSALPAGRDTLLEVAGLPSPDLGPDDAAALAALSRVLRAAAAQLQALFAHEGRVDHTYIAGAARAALAEAGLPTDLALRTGLSLRHILVDEFQDTSVAQLELLEALTAGWEQGDGRTLFVVGDPMQSIYQFREAEVGCFLRARDLGIGTVRLTPLRLLRNFRSAPALIQWTNETFGRLFPVADDLRASAVAFTASLAGQIGPSGEPASDAHPVELRLLCGDDRAAETQAIVARVADLKASAPQASIAILVAARSHAQAIVAELGDAGIDTIGVELVPLAEVPIVRDLVALTRALCHLGDRTAWLAVLRAPWCGVSLATLTRLSARGDSRLVCEALRETDRLEECPVDERARLERAAGVLEGGLSRRDQAPLADWLEEVWMALGAPDAYPAEELRHARAFFDALSERTASGEWSGIDTLDSLLANLYAQPQARTAAPVQVLTIHGAKGLEFDHVLVPCLDRQRNQGREPLLRWLDLPRAEAERSDLIMAPAPVIGEGLPGDVNAFLKRLTALRAANEQVRLLYVAATRAKRSLHLYAAPAPRADGQVIPLSRTPLASLWPALARAFLAPSAATASPASSDIQLELFAGSQMRRVLRRLTSDWAPPALPAAPRLTRLPVAQRSLERLEFSWAGETRRHIGTVVHAALQSFAAVTELPSRARLEARAEIYREQLRRHGVPERDLAGAVTDVVEALARTVEDERGRWILSRDHLEAGSELALTGMAEGRLTNVVIDRSFVDRHGTRWVIDFKTSPHEGGRLEDFIDRELERYRGQLEKYAALARALGPEPVRAALYFPLLGVFREFQ
jgi:ATP-dependent helicase/nuclease subunit A